MANAANQSRSSKAKKPVQTKAPKQPASAASKAKAKAPAKAKGRTARKIDWEEAKRWYLADATRSYADVAKHFKVAKYTVETHAKAGDESWATTRQLLGENATKEFETELQQQLREANEKHLKQIRSKSTLDTNIVFDINNVRAEINKLPLKDRMPYIRHLATSAASMSTSLRAMIESERVILGLPIVIAKSENLVEDITPASDAEVAAANERWAKRQERIDAERRAAKAANAKRPKDS